MQVLGVGYVRVKVGSSRLFFSLQSYSASNDCSIYNLRAQAVTVRLTYLHTAISNYFMMASIVYFRQ